MIERLKLLLTRLKTKKIYLPLLGFFTVIILVLISLWQRGELTKKPNQTIPSPIVKEKTNGSPPPVISFESYENKAYFPAVPSNLKAYVLKGDYPIGDVTEFGRKLGLRQVEKADETYVVMSNFNTQNDLGTLVFNRKTGAFSLQSYGLRKPAVQGNNIYETALNYLRELNVIDETVVCDINYQRKDMAGVTYVECHRDWDKIGLPVFNYVGLLNIPEEDLLSSLSLGRTGNYSPNDLQIYNTSTGDNGKARPNDFNTITVAIANDGRILSVESNLRQIKQSQQILSADLLSPQEALDMFNSHKAEFSLSIPAGSGFVDWNKVYPGNKAISKTATVTDYVLSYLEKPEDAIQTTLIPVYLIRGTARLESGYVVRFVETLSALRKTPSLTRNSGKSVLGDQDESEDSLQLKKFDPPTETPTPTRIVIPPTVVLSPTQIPTQIPTTWQPQDPSPPQEESDECIPLVEGGTPREMVLNVPGMGEMVVSNRGNAGTHTLYFRSASFPIDTVREASNIISNLVLEQVKINYARVLKSQPSVPTTETELHDALAALDLLPSSPSTRRIGESGIFTLIKNGQIDEYSSKQDIFPSDLKEFSDLDNYIGAGPSGSQLGKKLLAGCYISGGSPSLYVYAILKTPLSIALPGSESYSYPSTTNRLWNVTAYKDTISIGERNYSRLYYEYDKNKIKFIKPKDGFIIKSNNWESFIRNNLSLKINLNTKETEDLIVDARNALTDIEINNYPYMKISFINKTELNKKLPLNFVPQPDKIYRFHLLLTPLKSYVYSPEPKLDKIDRKGFVVLEIGVIAD
ncbi:MAG: hypothetical protein M1524_02790 [Patescibacteria group bacterium]|nr:hypothetical protein [Patescibacteria group bacterium]